MTTSDVTASDQRPEVWASLSGGGFSSYEVGVTGFGPDQRPVRSIDRVANGRRVKGVALKPKLGTHGYLEVKLYNDEGRQETRTVHSLVLLGHVGPCPPGMQTRHLDDDPLNNRWAPGDEAQARAAGGNLIYGTKAENVEDTFRNGRHRAPAKPVRHCVRCNDVMTGNGRRCHPCVVEIGVEAARLLRSGVKLSDAARHLNYPSDDGLHTLAVKYGGYGIEPPRLSRRVIATIRHLLHGGDAK